MRKAFITIKVTTNVFIATVQAQDSARTLAYNAFDKRTGK
jgi:hypothetical protein